MTGVGVFRDFLASLQICKSHFESILGFSLAKGCSDAFWGFNALFLPDGMTPSPLM